MTLLNREPDWSGEPCNCWSPRKAAEEERRAGPKVGVSLRRLSRMSLWELKLELAHEPSHRSLRRLLCAALYPLSLLSLSGLPPSARSSLSSHSTLPLNLIVSCTSCAFILIILYTNQVRSVLQYLWQCLPHPQIHARFNV